MQDGGLERAHVQRITRISMLIQSGVVFQLVMIIQECKQKKMEELPEIDQKPD